MMDINRYVDADENNQYSKINSDSNSNAMNAILDTSSTIVDAATLWSQSQSHATASFASASLTSGLQPPDYPPTPSSVVEAARISLRPRLRRSNSNRSISSTQSELITSTAIVVIKEQLRQKKSSNSHLPRPGT